MNNSDNRADWTIAWLIGLCLPAAVGAALFHGLLLVAVILVPLALLGWLCATLGDKRAEIKASNPNRRWGTLRDWM